MMQGIMNDARETPMYGRSPGFRPRSSIPKGFWHEEEEESEAKGHHNGNNPVLVKGCRRDGAGQDLPKHPPPTQRLNDDSAHQRHQILPTKQEESVDSDAEGSLVQKEDLGNGCRGKAFDRAD